MRELRYVFRSLSKQPAFCLSAILTLALGIGANTAMFSVFDAVVLHPLPYRDANRLVLVWQSLPGRPENPVLALNYVEWTKQAHSFDQLLGMRNLFVTFRNGGESHQLLGGQVSRGFFSALGLPPTLGREFLPGEVSSDHDHVAVASYDFWQRELGADPHALGRSLNLNGESYTLIGVAPASFEESLAVRGVDIWTPLNVEKAATLHPNNMAVFGRLKPSVTIEQANAEMQLIAKRLELKYPDRNRGWSASVTALEDYGTGKLRSTAAALLLAVGMILLIACVNVANLLLARAEIRYKEVAIRAALGASRARLFRQLLTETMLLAFAGSLAGIALAYGGLRVLIAFPAVQLPGLSGAGLNIRVLAFTVAVTAVTGLLFGLLPARQLIGGDLNQAIRESGRSSINTRRGRGSRNVLVVSEIALSLILVAGAAMMARSMLWLQNENRGFVSDHLLTFRASFLPADFTNASSMATYYHSFLDRLAALPGVRSVGANSNLPIDGFLLTGEFFHLPGTPSTDRAIASCDLINTGYFRTLGIPVIQGREFDARDRDDSPPVAIVSASLARQYFPGQNPIGRKIVLPTPGRGQIEVTREIVGVAGDIRYLTRPGTDSLEIYLPQVDNIWPNIYVMIRATGDPSSLAPQLRAALREPGSNRQSIADMMTMQERIDALNGKPRFNSMLAAVFAAIALLLAAVGIYGVVAYSTSQRAQEIGVRMAMGATPGDIVRWILGQALVLTCAGIGLGLLGHFALSRVLASLLYGTGANDGLSLSLALVVLISIALLASYIPARRAVRGDPVAALRSE